MGITNLTRLLRAFLYHARITVSITTTQQQQQQQLSLSIARFLRR